jgi:hypothetical protein
VSGSAGSLLPTSHQAPTLRRDAPGECQRRAGGSRRESDRLGGRRPGCASDARRAVTTSLRGARSGLTICRSPGALCSCFALPRLLSVAPFWADRQRYRRSHARRPLAGGRSELSVGASLEALAGQASTCTRPACSGSTTSYAHQPTHPDRSRARRCSIYAPRGRERLRIPPRRLVRVDHYSGRWRRGSVRNGDGDSVEAHPAGSEVLADPLGSHACRIHASRHRRHPRRRCRSLVGLHVGPNARGWFLLPAIGWFRLFSRLQAPAMSPDGLPTMRDGMIAWPIAVPAVCLGGHCEGGRPGSRLRWSAPGWADSADAGDRWPDPRRPERSTSNSTGSLTELWARGFRRPSWRGLRWNGIRATSGCPSLAG